MFGMIMELEKLFSSAKNVFCLFAAIMRPVSISLTGKTAMLSRSEYFTTVLCPTPAIVVHYVYKISRPEKISFQYHKLNNHIG